MAEWIDVSVALDAGLVSWPGDPGLKLEQTLHLSRGDPYNLSRLATCVHIGTHMDAPAHFIDGAARMGALPLDAVLGAARVIEVADPLALRAAELAAHAPQPGERLLFKTRNSRRDWARMPFDEDFVYIARDAAEMLAAAKVRTVGIDYLSVGGYAVDAAETHVALLGAGVWVIEGLDLRAVAPGRYELACLPLKLIGAEGAPARAALRPL